MLRFSPRNFHSRIFSVNGDESTFRNSCLPRCMSIVVVLLKGEYVKRLELFSDTVTVTATKTATMVLNQTNPHIHTPIRCFRRKRDLNEIVLVG